MRPFADRAGSRISAIAVALLTLLAACAGAPAASPTGGGPEGAVRIASFDFTESRILAELYAQTLEGAGMPVRRVGPLASREILQPALEQDVVDLVPEYTGSALEFVNRRAGRATADASTNHELLRQALAARDLDVLAMAPAQNQNAVAVTSSTANRLALTKVSDLVPHARGLVFGGAPECAERPFCLGGLQSLYGLRFKAVRVLDASGPATVGALEGNEVDVALLFTTNPHVGPKRFVLLADDLGLQPADNVVPVLRRAAIERWGDRLPAVLDAVSVALSTAELSHLNASVDLHGRSEADVARDWLRHHGLAGR